MDRRLPDLDKRVISDALSDVLLQTPSDQLSDTFNKINKLEERMLFENDNDPWYQPVRTAGRIAKELTEVTVQDIKNQFEYERIEGYFDMDYDPVPYAEGIRFGEWVTEGEINFVESGHYKIDESNPEYQVYRQELMGKTICSICEKYSEAVFDEFITDENMERFKRTITYRNELHTLAADVEHFLSHNDSAFLYIIGDPERQDRGAWIETLKGYLQTDNWVQDVLKQNFIEMEPESLKADAKKLIDRVDSFATQINEIVSGNKSLSKESLKMTSKLRAKLQFMEKAGHKFCLCKNGKVKVPNAARDYLSESEIEKSIQLIEKQASKKQQNRQPVPEIS